MPLYRKTSNYGYILPVTIVYTKPVRKNNQQQKHIVHNAHKKLNKWFKGTMGNCILQLNNLYSQFFQIILN